MNVLEMIMWISLFVCITTNAIHKRNAKVEIAKEALKNGISVDVNL